MEKYVFIDITNSDFTFSIKENLNEKEEENKNKNSIYLNMLIYEYKYFIKNIYFISKILNEFIIKTGTNKIIINDILLIDPVIDLFTTLEIPYLYIIPDRSLSINQCERILSDKSIRYLKCFYIPPICLEKFKNKNIQCDLMYDENVSDEFLLSIDCINHETLYYKKNIIIKEQTEEKLRDLEEFLKINQDLKGIHLYSYSEEYIKKIINILRKLNELNISILLHVSGEDLEYLKSIFKPLKEVNKEYSKEFGGEIRIVYSKGFIINNLFKQLSYNNLKLILYIIAYISFVSILFGEFYSYVAKQNMNKLNDIIINEPIIIEEGGAEENTTDPNDPRYRFDEVFPTLLSINNETIGWLTVKNTYINYPIVQHSDNSYYLNRDFYKSKTANGWVFMDYRNNIDSLDKNTIIYGHRLRDDTMFGSLDLILSKDWYTNPDNLVIKFNTLNTNMNWQVFSIYKVDYTIDYLQTTFENETEFNNFIHLISNRSVYNFKISLNYEENILTLSTCIGDHNQRLVVHAKLIKEIINN